MRKFENNKNIIKLNKLKKRLQVCLNMNAWLHFTAGGFG